MTVWSGIPMGVAAVYAAALVGFVISGHWILAAMTLPGTIVAFAVLKFMT